MQNVLRLSVMSILIAVLMAVLAPVSAQDCPEEDGSVTVADRVEDAEIVLEGTIVDIYEYVETQPGQQIAIVNVSQYFKGTGPSTVTLSGFGQRENCLQSVQVSDEPLLFFVIDDAGTFRAYYPLLPNGAYLMTDDLRNDVIAAAGQDAVTPDPALAPNMAAYSTADAISNPRPTNEAVAVAPTVEGTLVVQATELQSTDVPPTAIPTAALVTGTAPAADEDDGSSIDVLPIILGVVVLVVMLGGGLLFASRRSEPEE